MPQVLFDRNRLSVLWRNQNAVSRLLALLMIDPALATLGGAGADFRRRDPRQCTTSFRTMARGMPLLAIILPLDIAG